MNHHFSDILDRIPVPPSWWDENAVPRYCDFGPRETANIYADESVLLLIECQECGTPYKVCLTESKLGRMLRGYGRGDIPSLAERVGDNTLNYGDPPNACPDGCVAGATMNSVPRRVLEFWRRGEWDENRLEWERVAELECEIVPDWMPHE